MSAKGPRLGYEAACQEVLALSRGAFEALGLKEPVPPKDGLRELNITARAPGLRLLYSVDAARGRALLILGEPLDRCVYGPWRVSKGK